MKKIIKISAFLGLMFSSVNIFAQDIIGPKHRLEGSLSIGRRFDRKNAIGKFKGDQIPSENNTLLNWTEYNSISAVYRPEWTVPVNDLLSITFGPSINLGSQLNLNQENKDTQANSIYGFEGGLGAELDLNFQIPDSEVVYLGFDYIFKGIGYVDFSQDLGKKTVSRGFQTGVGFSIGGKVSDKIKLGIRLGYEYKQLWNGNKSGEKNKQLLGQHIMPISINFGYILGE